MKLLEGEFVMVFEPQFPSTYSWLFHGHLQTQVLDPHGQPASTIIAKDDDFHLKVSWQLHGTLVPALCGKWHVTAFLESIGPGPEYKVPLGDYDMDKSSYDFEYPIHPKILNMEPGPYKLVTVITATNKFGKPMPFAAFEESPMLQVYEGESFENS
jgi:hypothetical protein